MIGQQMPASFDTARGREPTLCRAGIAAEKNGRKLATGSRFLCPRLGPMTREKCLGNFQAGHSACTTGFVCGIGRLEAEKEGLDVGYNTKKGDCACGTKDVQLDKYGRCYKCQAAIRDKARRLARMTPAASEDATPPVVPSEAAPSIQAVQGGCPAFDPHAKIDFPNGAAARELVEHHGRLLVAENVTPEPADLSDDPDLSDDLDLPDAGYAPGVTAVVETLPPEGQLVGDEDQEDEGAFHRLMSALSDTSDLAPAEAGSKVLRALEEWGSVLKAAILPDDAEKVAEAVNNVTRCLDEWQSALGAAAMESDEDPAPGACQGWPETAGTLVIDGMEFEAFTSTRAKASPTPLLSVQSGKTFSFNTGAIETFDLARFAYVELFASADRKSVAFRFSEDSPASGRGVKATDSKDRLRKRIGAQGFMSAFGLDLKGKGPWPVEQPQPGVLVARVG
jgi:hypothetical protein